MKNVPNELDTIAEVEALLRAVASVTAYDVGSLCEIPAHKPLRHPMCPHCQLAGRIEELRAEAKRIRDEGRQE